MGRLKEMGRNPALMPDRFTGFLDAYDLFGKAIPGVAWFFGLVLVAPTTLEVGFPGTSVELKGIAVLVVISALVGVVFGQGVDILARLFEQFLAWIRKQVRRLAHLVLVILGKLSIGVQSRLGPKLEDVIDAHPKAFSILITGTASFGITAAVLAILTRGPSLLVLVVALLVSGIISGHTFTRSVRIEMEGGDEGDGPDGFLERVEVLEDFKRPDPSAVLANTYRWVLGRLNVINTAVTSHRSLFAAYLDSRADAYVEPIDPDDIAYGRFEAVVEPFLEVDLEDFVQQDIQSSYLDLYPFITSHLRANGFNRAKGFQARYSFCRSMWLTTSIFATILLGLHLHVSGSPQLGDLSRSEPAYIVSLVLVILWFLLLAALVGRFFELASRSIGRYSPTVVWVIGLGYSFLALSSDPLREWIVILAHKVLWQVLSGLVKTIVVVSKATASLSGFLFGYESFDKVVAVQIFDESLLGLAILLLVSTVAFFDATGAYKRNYVEYLVAEAFIGLPDGEEGPADDGADSSETYGGRDLSSGNNTGSGSDGEGNSDGGDTDEGGGQEVSETVGVNNALQTVAQQSEPSSRDEAPGGSKQEEDTDGD